MIRNDREYRIVQSRMQRLLGLQNQLEPEAPEKDPIVAQLERQSVRGEIHQMRSDIADYEALKEGRAEVGIPETIADLPRTLIRGRIAAGMTQADLAEALGLQPQQIQRYEATDYESASLARLTEIAEALDISLSPAIAEVARTELPSMNGLLRQLERVGLPRDLIMDRLADPELQDEASRVADIVGRLAHLFNWSPREILHGEAYLPDTVGVAYKQSTDADEGRVRGYSAWAEYLVNLVVRCTPSRDLSLPVDPAVLHEELVSNSPTVSFEDVVRGLWERGVVVLPLADRGGFDAAYFRRSGRDVIVIKHRPWLESLWLFDVLHECGHAVEEGGNADRELVELQPGSGDDPSEQYANRYAVTALFGGRTEELFDRVVHAAQGSMGKMKRATQMIARQEQVDQGLLAFQVAHRLSERGENWWGTAYNLQRSGENPWQTARDLFIDGVNWTALGALDRELLMRAVQDPEAVPDQDSTGST